MVWPLRFSRAAPGRKPRIEGGEDGRLSIDGNIDGGEVLFIEALVNGDVTAGRVSIGAAVIHGEVHGRSVAVAGTVHGAIVASDVQLAEGAIVHGRIEHLSLSVAQMADFEGESVRLEPEAMLKELTGPTEVEAGDAGPQALAG